MCVSVSAVGVAHKTGFCWRLFYIHLCFFYLYFILFYIFFLFGRIFLSFLLLKNSEGERGVVPHGGGGGRRKEWPGGEGGRGGFFGHLAVKTITMNTHHATESLHLAFAIRGFPH